MTQDKFWKIIEKANGITNPDEIVNVVREELEKCTPQELIEYQKHFDTFFDKANRWDIWGAIYLIHGGCGDDSFMDFRYTLISRGKDIYEKAIQEPDSLVTLRFNDDIFEDLFNEMFGYIAIELYEEKTDDDIYNSINLNNTEEDMGEEWDFDDRDECLKRLPKITEKFWKE